ILALLKSIVADDKRKGYEMIDEDEQQLNYFSESLIRTIKDELSSIDSATIKLALKWLANSPISADFKTKFGFELDQLLDSG
ncbi:hypothetical protein PRIPAC_97930, partial [Pristionchus pacificus]|uniref:Uncharacterized protein n=1 Tax=Pristionchus pacificus TaxID=54126 RepID=A0A2A6CU62_PRIPA